MINNYTLFICILGGTIMGEVTREQYEKIVDELAQIMDTNDAIEETISILDILGIDYSNIEELN
jgi:hypothetical protein